MSTITELLKHQAVRKALAEHYRKGVTAAVNRYEDNAADEDSVTGALGQALSGDGDINLGKVALRWKTSYRKLRGRGRGAPEKKFGADGIFEIEFEDERGIRSRKSLPFQAKNNISSYGRAELRDQARKLGDFPGGGIVVNYRPEGYSVIDADVVASGSATRSNERPLSEVLSGDFLECTCGSATYFFEPALKGIIMVQAPMLLMRRWAPEHRIRTSLKARSKHLSF